MDKEQAIELAQRYKAIVAERLPLKSLYLYGSYSKGNQTEDSDIDIAVVVERMSDNYFDDTPLLWKLKRKVSNLIEPVLLTEDFDNPPLYRCSQIGNPYLIIVVYKSYCFALLSAPCGDVVLKTVFG